MTFNAVNLRRANKMFFAPVFFHLHPKHDIDMYLVVYFYELQRNAVDILRQVYI